MSVPCSGSGASPARVSGSDAHGRTRSDAGAARACFASGAKPFAAQPNPYGLPMP